MSRLAPLAVLLALTTSACGGDGEEADEVPDRLLRRLSIQADLGLGGRLRLVGEPV